LHTQAMSDMLSGTASTVFQFSSAYANDSDTGLEA
jgi:hypothetical protein